MIELPEAQRLILDAVGLLEAHELPIEEAADHLAAADIISSSSVAPFRNSAMDGFAVAAQKITHFPAILDITDTVFAGNQPPTDLDQTKAVKIMTGAPIPDAYDTVIKFEDTTYDSKRVTIHDPITAGQNVRQPGEDIAVGETIIKKGRLIRFLDIGILASTGLRRVSVTGQPRILILSTGDELARAGEPLKFGQIYDSNSYTIDALTRNFRSSVEKRVAVADDLESLKEELSSDHEVIISTGGVSMGEKDLLPALAEQIGWQPLLHKVAIKPGKPIFVATKPGQILFGLPGNPLSAAVTCAIMVLPALKKMVGCERYLPNLVEATLDRPAPVKSGRTLVWPGHIRSREGRTEVKLAGKRSSAALSALLDSDGLIYISKAGPEASQQVRAVKWQQLLNL